MTVKTITLKRNLASCLLLSCFCYCFRTAHTFEFQRIARPQRGPQRRHHFEGSSGRSNSGSILCARSDPEDKNEQTKRDGVEDEDPVEEFLAMEEASRKVTSRLMFPRMVMTSIGESIRYLAYGFLIFSFVLNVAGYAIIRDDNSLRIGTLEDRDFQMEISKSMKDK